MTDDRSDGGISAENLKRASSQTMRIDIVPETEARPIPRLRRQTGPKKSEVTPVSGRDFSEAATWQDRYEAVLNSMYDAAFVTDTSGVITNSNSRASSFFLLSKDELLGHNITSFISGADKELLATLVSDMKSQRFALIQAYCVRGDSSVFPAEISVSFADFRKDNLCFFVRDVTVRKQREDRLLEQQNAIKHAGSGIAMCGLDDALTYVNPAMAAMWGYESVSELVGRNVSSLWADGCTNDAKSLFDRIMGTRERWAGDLAAKRRDGSTF